MKRSTGNSKKVPKQRNSSAKALENPLFRQRKIPSKKVYDRKKMEKPDDTQD